MKRERDIRIKPKLRGGKTGFRRTPALIFGFRFVFFSPIETDIYPEITANHDTAACRIVYGCTAKPRLSGLLGTGLNSPDNRLSIASLLSYERSTNTRFCHQAKIYGKTVFNEVIHNNKYQKNINRIYIKVGGNNVCLIFFTVIINIHEKNGTRVANPDNREIRVIEVQL